MGDTLDNATDRARANASLRRTHVITWGEQREFLERHREEFGDLYFRLVARVRDGYARYRDDAFWYIVDELEQMEEEEDIDRMFYRCLRLHQDEVDGLRR
jgi:hypothetical protein